MNYFYNLKNNKLKNKSNNNNSKLNKKSKWIKNKNRKK